MTGRGGDGEDLTLLSVNLTPPARSALEKAASLTGDGLTDTVNRALLLYAQVAELAEHEGAYRVDVEDFDDRPLFLLVSRSPLVSQKRKWFPW